MFLKECKGFFDLNDLISKIIHRFDNHMQELLRGASVAFILKILAAGLAFGLNVILARMLGAEGSGIYFLSYTVILVVATFGRVGMENALVRFIAANIVAKKPQKVLGVYGKAMLYSSIASIPLSLILYLLAPVVSLELFNKPALEFPLTVMCLAVAPLALFTLHAHALQGLKEIAASVLTLSIIVPMLTCLVVIIFTPNYGINAAVWGYLFANYIALLFGRWFWVKSTRVFAKFIADYDRKELLSSSTPMFFVVIMNMVITWMPTLFLGVWESADNIGIFSAANRTAMLISFVLVAVNSIAAPKFAALYQQGRVKELGLLARNSSKLMIIFALPVFLFFIVFPDLVMSIFGSEFETGALVLVILATGQFVNVVTGSVVYLLMMSGNERLMRNNLLFCLSIGLLINPWLISSYGIIGGAIGATFILSIQNIIAVILVYRKLGILTLPWILYQKKVNH